MTTTSETIAVPRAGMLATVRNRRGVVAAVEPFDGETGRLHLVHLEYKDDRAPSEERILWEIEPSRRLDEPNALPNPAHPGGAMSAEDFDALLRTARWTALSPYLDPAGGEGPPPRESVASPFHGGVCVESYQLVPLLKALRMPRVSLLIADDVGLGKTVEAGLILTELLLRRRIQRVLVLTPASLRRQWQEELWEKFSLRFEVVDRRETERLHRRQGMDANPWRSFSRIVASYHYLRQPDVLERFLSACRTPEGSPHLPWDLLIVDECHNLMPSPFGEDSELCKMLRLVAPQFEHRLFLSATPHNGHTRSFTGLLEMLDPVRFTRASEMTAAMRGRVEDVVVRRLKREINARCVRPGSAGRAASRKGNVPSGASPGRRDAGVASREGGARGSGIRAGRRPDHGSDARRGCPLRRPRRADREPAPGRLSPSVSVGDPSPSAPVGERRVPRRRAPDRLHGVQDDARLPRPALARALPRGASAHPVRDRRRGRRFHWHGRGGPRERQGGVQRPGLVGAHPRRHRRRVRGPEPPPHRPLPAALRLSMEPPRGWSNATAGSIATDRRAT